MAAAAGGGSEEGLGETTKTTSGNDMPEGDAAAAAAAAVPAWDGAERHEWRRCACGTRPNQESGAVSATPRVQSDRGPGLFCLFSSVLFHGRRGASLSLARPGWMDGWADGRWMDGSGLCLRRGWLSARWHAWAASSWRPHAGPVWSVWSVVSGKEVPEVCNVRSITYRDRQAAAVTWVAAPLQMRLEAGLQQRPRLSMALRCDGVL